MASDKIKSATEKLLEINQIITKLDPAIRSAAFDILTPLVFEEEDVSEKPGTAHKKQKQISTADKEKFLSLFEHDKPKDYVLLIAAWLYSQHGVFPITKALMDEEASNAGLTVPERPDNTMRTAKQKGKNLFRQKNSGWQLTVAGEAYLKETYSVKKGNKPVPEAKTE